MNLEKEIFEIELKDIMPNRFQPREIFDDEPLQELAASIKEHGVIQPIIVRKVGDKYEIIAGERRYRASQLAGKQTIPALIRDIDDKEAAKIALLENLQRKDLTPIEEAKTYQTILKLDNITQEELAQNLGKSQSAIANKLRLLNLDEEVQTALLNSQISERHARSLLTLTPENQRNLLSKIINVRQVDEERGRSTGRIPEMPEDDITPETNQTINPEPFIPNNPLPNQNVQPENIVGMPQVNNNQEQTLQQQNPAQMQNIELQNENQIGVQPPINQPIINTEIPTPTQPQPEPAIIQNQPQPQAGSTIIQSQAPVQSEPITNQNENQIGVQPPINQPIINTEIPNQTQNQMPENQPMNNQTPEIPETPKVENIFDKLRVNPENNVNESQNNQIIEQTPSQTTNEPNYDNIYDLRFAINNFRQAIQNTEKFGFKVKAEEYDNPNSYQIVIKIDKNN